MLISDEMLATKTRDMSSFFFFPSWFVLARKNAVALMPATLFLFFFFALFFLFIIS